MEIRDNPLEKGSPRPIPGRVGTVDGVLLDHPVWSSLSGPHARFASASGRSTCYPSQVSPFVAVAPGVDKSPWDNLAALLGPGRTAVLGHGGATPQDWVVERVVGGVQMLDAALEAQDHPGVEVLGSRDVPEMLELIRRTRPGPFGPRTIEMGTYLGLRRNGSLVATAGQRLHPPGWTEISAVCTRPDHRGRGFASTLVQALGAEIRGRGEKPFLHAAATNLNAIRLYASLGFVLRREVTFQVVRAPGGVAS